MGGWKEAGKGSEFSLPTSALLSAFPPKPKPSPCCYYGALHKRGTGRGGKGAGIQLTWYRGTRSGIHSLPSLLLRSPWLRSRGDGMRWSLGWEKGGTDLPGPGRPLPTQLSLQIAEAALPSTPACLQKALKEGRSGQAVVWETGQDLRGPQCSGKQAGRLYVSVQGDKKATEVRMGSVLGTLCLKETVTVIPSNILPPQHLILLPVDLTL